MAWTRHGLAADAGFSPGTGFVTFGETATDDTNSKTFTVGSDCEPGTFRVVGCRFVYTATATVGTRTMQWQVLDESSNIVRRIDIESNDDPAASDVVDIDASARSARNPAGTAGGSALHEWPVYVILHPGWAIRLIDTAGIDSDDDMDVWYTMEKLA